jgi:hypothetical protein
MPNGGRRTSGESSVIVGASGRDLRAESLIGGELSSSHERGELEDRESSRPLWSPVCLLMSLSARELRLR